MKKRYGDKCKLLMTDTDSLHYQIEREDLYKDLKELAKELPTMRLMRLQVILYTILT